MKIEYLKDFNSSPASLASLNPPQSFSSPTWEILDGPNFSRLVGKSVLCRMTKYVIPMSLLQPLYRPEILDMKVYDEYFILNPDQIISTSAQISNAPASFGNLSAFLASTISITPVAGSTSSESLITYSPMTDAITVIDALPIPTIIDKGSFDSLLDAANELKSAHSAMRQKASIGTLVKGDVTAVEAKFKNLMFYSGSNDSESTFAWIENMESLMRLAKANNFTP